MSLKAIVFKGMLALEQEFPGYRFEREPISGECEVVYPDGARIPWEAVKVCEQWFGNVSHIGTLRGRIARYVGKASALKRLVLYSGSHAGDVIEEARFGELEGELALLEASSDEYVGGFAVALRTLIGAARQERNPIVFV
ncbi:MULTISPECIES: hypothetical protein [unclassified Mesorhizobium]|uniref:hypothetical protein n=1 Tax=unclassified Mesorhizobium TaxID=325217 RepID=UPI00112D8F6E|nr:MULTISPECIES: hypothetical protein [unclassified Mesorhizobium]TPM94481.1 hypothetical protein FJ977_20405 [Mesorhizobium sp. B2-1-3A]BCG87124.1 hypothetical protein MesoLj113c_32340 [Mesorhizobium sp. 113-3-9]